MFTTLKHTAKMRDGMCYSHNTYFKAWENAKEKMDEDVNCFIKKGYKVIRSVDRMNTAKGFYEYEKSLLDKENFVHTFALINCYFCD